MRVIGALILGVHLWTPLHAEAQQCHLAVSVYADEGSLSEARVEVFNRQGVMAATGVTDADGRLVISLPPAEYFVRASVPGFAGINGGTYASATVDPVAGVVVVRLLLHRAPPPGRPGGAVPRRQFGEIRGWVRTPDGVPIVDAEIEASGYAGGTLRRTRTAPDGSYRLRVTPGTYSIHGWKGSPTPPRFASSTMPQEWHSYPTAFLKPHLHVGPDAVVQARDLVLVQARAVRMTVTVRDESGAVVPSASVRFHARRGVTRIESGESTTGADGTAELGLFTPGEVELHAWARTGTPGALAGILRVSVGEAPLDVTVVLPVGATIRGHVEFEGRTGLLHGPSGLRVEDGLSGWRSGDPRGVVRPDGSFVLDALVDGQCLSVTGIPAGWHVAAIDLFGEDYLARPLRLAPAETVSGLVIRMSAEIEAPRDRGACGRERPESH